MDGPEWILDPPSLPGSVVFIGEGRGEDEAEARSNAYLSALSRMGAALGHDIINEYYREFLSSGRIMQLGTYVSDSYAAADSSGYYFYIMAATPSVSFEAERSEEIERAAGIDREIGSLLSSASAHYRANEDVDALSDVLSAVSLALDGSLGYSADDLLSRATSYLESMTLSVSDADGALCSVRLRRTSRLFSPPVANGRVSASYSMVDNSGSIIGDSITAMTDEDGTFRFPVTNPYMVRKGELVFTIGVPEDVISGIESKAPAGFLSGFLGLLEEKSVVYSYSIPDRFPHENTLMAFVPYIVGEDMIFPAETFRAYCDQLRSAGVGYEAVIIPGENEADIMARLRTRYPEKRYIIVTYLDVTDSREASDGFYARVDGRNFILDGGEVITEEEIFAADGGESMDEAARNALERGARIAAGMLLKEI